MADDFTFVDDEKDAVFVEGEEIPPPMVKVVGIGGCGNKSINHLINTGIGGVEYIGVNSDPTDLTECVAPTRLLIGARITRRRGCGGKPELGRKAGEESIKAIKKTLENADLVFITAGMGGGTGSGATPVVAEALSKLELPPLVISVVTTPFSWEKKRYGVAEQVIRELSAHSNCVITVSNSKLQKLAPTGASMDEAKAMANDVLYKALCGLLEILTKNGDINLDFADVEETLRLKGPALIGVGEATGDDRAKKALNNAIACPLMTQNSIKGAQKILVNVVGARPVALEEFDAICSAATEQADEDAEVFTGLMYDDSLKDTGALRVTVIATGLKEAVPDGWEEKDPAANGDEEPIILETCVDEPIPVTRVEDDFSGRGVLSPQRPALSSTRPTGSAPLPYPTPPPTQRAYTETSLATRPMGVGVSSLAPSPLAANPLGARITRPAQPSAPANKNQRVYERQHGVDEINSNPDYYNKPAFLRKDAS
ncbi:MAG: cell division FtsZ family protein [Deltaproteobacteria bacterium]|jgi:cell division protein FtsZ|nr:cell division FtsZ family protein [Deltaproteobacteria bacterium]